MMLQADLIQSLREARFRKVGRYGGKKVTFCCPMMHNGKPDQNPSAYIDLDNDYFYCTGCKTFMRLRLFMMTFEVDGFVKFETAKQLKFKPISLDAFDKRLEKGIQPDNEMFEMGLRYMSEAADYRLYKPVVKYFEKRLGPGFMLPRHLKVMYHEERQTLLMQALYPDIYERFKKGSKNRVKNWSPGHDGSLFHFNRKPVEILVVVEGLFDALKVYNMLCQMFNVSDLDDTGWGVAAMMTSNISDLKIRQIEEISTKDVILWFDDDKAGKEGQQKAYDKVLSIGRRPRRIDYYLSPTYSELIEHFADQPEILKELTDPCSLEYSILKEILYANLKEKSIFNTARTGL